MEFWLVVASARARWYSWLMISKGLIKKLKDDLEHTSRVRSKIVSQTHGLGREAKHVGFKLQRGEFKEAEKALKDLESKIKLLVKESAKSDCATKEA